MRKTPLLFILNQRFLIKFIQNIQQIDLENASQNNLVETGVFK